MHERRRRYPRSAAARTRPMWRSWCIASPGFSSRLFLPLHFWALGQAIESEARLESFLRWTDNPLTKFAEFLGLVVLLAAHLGGGLRILFIEFVGWRDWQSRAIAFAFALGLFAFGLLFLLNLGSVSHARRRRPLRARLCGDRGHREGASTIRLQISAAAGQASARPLLARDEEDATAQTRVLGTR